MEILLTHGMMTCTKKSLPCYLIFIYIFDRILENCNSPFVTPTPFYSTSLRRWLLANLISLHLAIILKHYVITIWHMCLCRISPMCVFPPFCCSRFYILLQLLSLFLNKKIARKTTATITTTGTIHEFPLMLQKYEWSFRIIFYIIKF